MRYFAIAAVSMVGLALFAGCAHPRARQRDMERAENAFRIEEGVEENQRRPRLSSRELDRLLEADEETENAERAGEMTREREAVTRPSRPKRKSFDARMEAPRHTATRATTRPVGLLDLHDPGVVRAVMLQGSLKQITLRKDFVEKYKNRVTITSAARVVHAGKVHSQADDGDEHLAVLADEVNLPLCAEIMNARSEDAAVTAMNEAEENDDIIHLSGAWRLWCEHPGNKPHIQDEKIAKYTNSNPDHVFEIHPVHKATTAGGSIDLRHTLKPISGYTPKVAKTAFDVYESLPCRIEFDQHDQTVSIFTKKVGYNYAKFKMKITDEEQFETLDGRIVRSDVLGLSGSEVANNIRMVFIKGTPPELAVKNKNQGDELTVLGMPRIDLAVVSWRVRKSASDPAVLDRGLPYEMVIVGVYP